MTHMKTCYLDANVLVYFSLHESPFHKKSTDIIERLYSDKYSLYTSPLSLDEYIHAIKRTITKERIQSLYSTLHSVLKSILALTEIQLINPPTDPASQLH